MIRIIYVAWRCFHHVFRIKLTICLISLILQNVDALDRRPSARIVTTKYGAVRGNIVTLPNRNLQQVEVFLGKCIYSQVGHFLYWFAYYLLLGIPYASPPIGKLRLMPPVTAAHWAGVKDANRPASACPQIVDQMNNITQQEDCLYLNIFTPISGKIRLWDKQMHLIVSHLNNSICTQFL